MKYLLLITLLFSELLSNAQDKPSAQRPEVLQNVIPPAPNAASLGKYADWPVSLYTGVPEINIPLYELKGHSISVPISISYHASGIKVGDVASSVGLGWALNAGGVITRSVRGLPDEAPTIGYWNLSKEYNNPGDLTSGIKVSPDNNSDSLNMVKVANGQSDSEPDLYMLNALGRSFKFFLAGNGNFVTQPLSGVIIKPHLQDNTWLVTLEDGTKLVFGTSNAIEITNSTRQMTTNSDMPSFVSSWYLKTITSPKGETITFNYQSSTINQDASYYEASYLLQTQTLTSCATNAFSKPFTHSFETNSVSIVNLLSIVSDLGKVVFINNENINYGNINSGNTRLDLVGGMVLNEIDVYSYLANNKLIHKFTFNHSYSQAASSIGYTTPNSAQAQYRLKLNSIQEVPVDGSSPKVWSFTYNPKTLPSRQSFAQDHWGYFNGAVNNTTMLPAVLGFADPNKFSSGNREGDSVSMAAEMLTQITYPTGGYTQFNFEPNSITATKISQVNANIALNFYLANTTNPFSNNKSQTFTTTVDQYINLTATANFSTSITNDYGPNSIIGSIMLVNSTNRTILNIQINTKMLTKGQYVLSKKLSVSPDTYYLIFSTTVPASDFVTSSDIVNIYGNISYLAPGGVISYYKQPVGGLRIKSMVDYSGAGVQVQRNFTYQIPNVVPFDPVNDYISTNTDKTFDCQGGCTPTTIIDGPNTNIEVAWDYYDNKGNYLGSSYGEYPLDPAKITYSKPSVSTIYYASNLNISGLDEVEDLFKYPNLKAVFKDASLSKYYFINDYKRLGGIPGTFMSSSTYLTRSSTLKCALGSIQGGTVGYGQVTTTYGPIGGNGYTVSYFSQATDLNVASSKAFPFPPVVPIDWQAGLLLKEITYDNNNNPLKKSTNNYSFVNQQMVTTFKVAPSFNTSTPCYNTNPISSFITKVPYNIITQQVQKNRSTSVSYFNNGADSVVTTTNYFYDNPANYQPTRIETLNSRNETIKVINNTSLELSAINNSIPLSTSAITAIDTMQNRNMVSDVIESETYNNNLLVSKVLTIDSLFNNLVLPREVKTIDGNNPIQSRVLFNKYDNFGNLLEQQKTNGSLDDYIWDYNNTYPIAAVVNGSQPNIAYTGFETGGSGGWTIYLNARDSVTVPYSGTKSYKLSLGNISKSGLTATTTYIVSYWTPNSNPFTITGTSTGYPIKGATNANGWTYYEHQITGQTTISLSGTGNIDELRLYPQNAQMTTYTYDPLVGLTSSTDAKGETTYYEYDSFQRLMNIKDKDGNIVKHIDYHYLGQ